MSKTAKRIKTIDVIKGYDQYENYVEIDNVDNIKGIYAIGQDLKKTKGDSQIVLAKIGLGGLNMRNEGGLLKRLKSYYIAYPDGFWEYSFLLTLKKDEKFLRQLEKEIHDKLEKYRYKSEYLTNLKKPEWFKTSIKKIREVFVEVHNEYPNDTYVVFPATL